MFAFFFASEPSIHVGPAVGRPIWDIRGDHPQSSRSESAVAHSTLLYSNRDMLRRSEPICRAIHALAAGLLGLPIVAGAQAPPKASTQPATRTQRPAATERNLRLIPHRITLAGGRVFELYVPEGFDIKVAADGLKRVRFMARSPDNRIFLTDMYNRADNNRGKVYILDGFDAKTGRFEKVIPFLTGLRNPNSVAFHTDRNGVHWLYLALTEKLVRYRYSGGETAPSGPPEVLATFPDYGLNYKYGGWHLTRTIAFADDGRLYVSVGSSCNACIEKEPIRATVVEMDADGKNQKILAKGLRNSVGLKWVQGKLYATDMGADHLGDDRPEDAMYVVEDGRNYGWPYCYQYRSRRYADPQFKGAPGALDCATVPAAYAAFPAHSSPLGFEYFDSTARDARLRDLLSWLCMGLQNGV